SHASLMPPPPSSLTPPSASPHLTSRLPQPHLTPHPRGFQIHKGVQREDNSLSLVRGVQISCGRRSLVPSFYTNLLYSISLFSTTLPLVRIASLFKLFGVIYVGPFGHFLFIICTGSSHLYMWTPSDWDLKGCTSGTTNMETFLGWLLDVTFEGGGLGDAYIAEGLAEALLLLLWVSISNIPKAASKT
ncbi:hypothetical protein FCV25MIE_33579, partial [Fagus crenata]